MRSATAVSKVPPIFFVSVASKGFRSTVAADSTCVRFVGARPFEAQGKHAVPEFPATAVPTMPPRTFVSIASKGVRSTVGMDSPNVRAVETGRFEGPVVPPFAFAQGKQSKQGKYGVLVFSAASVPFVGAQFIAPFSPRPLPRRQCLMPRHLPRGAPKP